MRYLIVETDANSHYTVEELTEANLLDSENLTIRIFDLQLLQFHVKGNLWQAIQER